VAELAAKPSYSQFRLIGIADDGREIVRVDRMGPNGAIRVVSKDQLQSKGDRDYFKAAISLSAGEVYASPINFNREGDVIDTPQVPTLRVAAPVMTPDGNPFGILVVNIDMRPAFARIRTAARAAGHVYAVNELGDFLVHPDATQEFAFEFGRRARVQDVYPDFVPSASRDDTSPRVIRNRAGEMFGLGWETVRLAGGPLITVIEAVPYRGLLATNTAFSSLIGALVAALLALPLVVLLARSLTRPLVQMTQAVEGFGRGETANVPVTAKGEIGVLARAFSRMTDEVRDKTAALKREIEERNRIFDTSPDLILVTDRQGNFIRVNPSSKATLGYEPAEMVGRSALDYVYPDDLEATREEMRMARRGRQVRNFQTRYVHKSGRVVTLVWSGVWSEPEQRHFFIGRDMTEQRLAEEKFQLAVEASPSGIALCDSEGRIVLVNAEIERLFGYRRDELIGQPIDALVPSGQEGEHGQHRWQFAAQQQTHRTVAGRELKGRRKDGSEFPIEVRLNAIQSSDGPMVMSVIVDVSERKRAEETLRESERMAHGIIAHSLDAIVQVNHKGEVIEWNPQAETIFGWSREEAVGKPITELYLPNGYRPRYIDMNERLEHTDGIIGERFEFEAVRKDGQRIQAEVSMTGVRRRDGNIYNLFLRDITAKLAEEERVRQSQKMEAVGQLTGGIAHDFNNMLTVITGTIDILAGAVANRPEIAAIAKLISEAADRGAELTAQLLAFARKQPLQPRETDINTLMIDSAKLLRPALGERIEIETRLDEDLWPALVDPGQLTTALLNLAVNARDAMPSGGKLTLEAQNVVLDETYVGARVDIQPGNYVMISVSDTGMGIPQSIRDKVFEPFFSTKEVGKGTGLGLSMVYGFVKQSGGHIMVYSEEGIGTTFRIYLPQARSTPAEATTAAPSELEGGSETILIVEDNVLVLASAMTQLTSLGYNTISAANANEALAIVDSGAAFDLLFTDVVMPGSLNGRELAEEIARRRPSVRVLFTSGYTEDAMVHQGRLDPGVVLLAKPYRKADLARLVRAALAAAPIAPSQDIQPAQAARVVN
jgi:PAS domain S-box-containing protein